MGEQDKSHGLPGKPGEPGTSRTGGTGGAGGVGGVGQQTGGAGGTGGVGGSMTGGTGNVLKNDLYRLAIATLGLFFVVLALGAWFKYDSLQKDKQIRVSAAEAHSQVARTTHALCAFDLELQARAERQTGALERTDAFIASHPHGIPGISIRLLRQSRADDAASLLNLNNTIKALVSLKCKEFHDH